MVSRRGDGKEPGTDVQAFLERLEHRRKDEVEAVRETILAAWPGVTERIKWNAPSFAVDGDDRITFRLQPGDRVQLVFHRGTRKRSDVGGFFFENDTGLLEWATPDRGLVTFRDLEDVAAKQTVLADLVRRWMAATADRG
jgi:Domain of unknown function (DU1801)